VNKSIVLVCLIEDEQKKDLLKISKELLIQSDYNIVYESKSKEIVGLSKNNRIIMLYSVTSDDLDCGFFKKINFDIVVNCFMDNIDNPNLSVFKNSDICILNSDDNTMLSILTRLNDKIAITYGFNNKATLTVSSYDVGSYISANICLQRNLNSLCGEKIEPFEYCLELSSNEEDKIYPLLAASLICLILGDGILNNKLYESIKINI